MEATPQVTPMPRRDGADGVDPIRDVVARADYEGFSARLADDVVFRSPAYGAVRAAVAKAGATASATATPSGVAVGGDV